MEERKRPAVTVDDDGRPSKRQAVNGTKREEEDGETNEDAWIEKFQKGAIFRRMLEYKREMEKYENESQDWKRRLIDRDDHIRLVDAWALQVLQDVEILTEGAIVSSSLSTDAESSSHHPQTLDDFERHLGEKADALKRKVGTILNRLVKLRGEVEPDASKLQDELLKLSAVAHNRKVKIGHLELQLALLSEQHDAAVTKLVKAERRADRAQSAQVQRLEQQALANATSRGTEDGSPSPANNSDFAELLIKYKETRAMMVKLHEQFDSALADMKTLQEEKSSLQAKKEVVTDSDYAQTDLFKQFKAKNEELTKSINNLEAVNKQLREEAQKLRAERTTFSQQLESETRLHQAELESKCHQCELDLARIRAARDELYATVVTRHAEEEKERHAMTQMKELLQAKDERIVALESESQRLRPSTDQDMREPSTELESLSHAELILRFRKQQEDYEAINKEIPLLEKAYKRSAAQAHTKVKEIEALEAQYVTLKEEKNRVNQKIYAARHDSDAKTNETRALRAQNTRSSEIISQLKEADAQQRLLIGNLEKQVAYLQQSNTSIALDNKKLKTEIGDAAKKVDSAKTQISELTRIVSSRDAANAALRYENQSFDREIIRLNTRLVETTSERDSWKNKTLSNSTEEEDMLRKLASCSVCRSNFKNTCLKGCGHLFCKECVETRLTNRMRKCPTCNKPFDRLDILACHL